MKVLFALLLAFVFPMKESAAAASASDRTPLPELAVAGAEGKLEHFGAVFRRSHSERNENVETEEYLIEGETRENWTQMLSFQRIVTVEPLGSDQYTALLKRQIDSLRSSSVARVVQQGKDASILAVHYGETETQPEQVVLALVSRPDSRRPNEMHVAQFIAHPKKVSEEELEALIKRWQARFQAQAAVLLKRGG